MRSINFYAVSACIFIHSYRHRKLAALIPKVCYMSLLKDFPSGSQTQYGGVYDLKIPTAEDEGTYYYNRNDVSTAKPS